MAIVDHARLEIRGKRFHVKNVNLDSSLFQMLLNRWREILELATYMSNTASFVLVWAPIDDGGAPIISVTDWDSFTRMPGGVCFKPEELAQMMPLMVDARSIGVPVLVCSDSGTGIATVLFKHGDALKLSDVDVN